MLHCLGSKRIRKQAKFLSNFILYATTKESEIEDTVNEMKNRAEILQDMLENKTELAKAIKEKESYIEKQLSLKDKVKFFILFIWFCLYD